METTGAMGWTRRGLISGAAAAALAGCSHRIEQPRRYVDGLSFLPDDLAEIRSAGLNAMICDVSVVEQVKDSGGAPRYLRPFARNDAALDAAIARLARSDVAYVALRGSDIGRRTGCGVFLQLQSAEPVGRDLARLAYFHAKGLRVLQLTHHNDTLFAGGAMEPVQTGLTPLGREAIGEMNRLHVLPDVSHGSDATMIEAARASRTPIVLSHGACRAIVDHPRCAPDAAIRAIAEGGGVVGIFMMSFWLTRAPQPDIEHLVAQLRHVIKIGGIEAAAIANDFPMAGQPNLIKLGNDNRAGVNEYLPWWRAMRERGVAGFGWTPEHVVIPQLNRIDRMVRIDRALGAAGFQPTEIDRIMGRNWLRLLTDVLG